MTSGFANSGDLNNEITTKKREQLTKTMTGKWWQTEETLTVVGWRCLTTGNGTTSIDKITLERMTEKRGRLRMEDDTWQGMMIKSKLVLIILWIIYFSSVSLKYFTWVILKKVYFIALERKKKHLIKFILILDKILLSFQNYFLCQAMKGSFFLNEKKREELT